ncbi:MAG: hypothetical protein AAGB51_06245 [Planctomycetota bacterium]
MIIDDARVAKMIADLLRAGLPEGCPLLWPEDPDPDNTGGAPRPLWWVRMRLPEIDDGPGAGTVGGAAGRNELLFVCEIVVTPELDTPLAVGTLIGHVRRALSNRNTSDTATHHHLQLLGAEGRPDRSPENPRDLRGGAVRVRGYASRTQGDTPTVPLTAVTNP